MAKRIVDEASLTGLADDIRAKSGTTESLVFPDGFRAAVDAIPTGGEVVTTSFEASYDTTITLPELVGAKCFVIQWQHTEFGLRSYYFNNMDAYVILQLLYINQKFYLTFYEYVNNGTMVVFEVNTDGSVQFDSVSGTVDLSSGYNYFGGASNSGGTTIYDVIAIK